MADTPQSKALAAMVIAGVRAAVERMAGPLLVRLKELEAWQKKQPEPLTTESIARQVEEMVQALPKPKDGLSVEPEDVRKMVSEAVAELPVPREPEPGKDADPEVIARMVAEAVAKIPAAEPGKDATPVDLENLAQRVLKEIPTPKDGVSVEPEDVAAMVERAVAAIPRPKDGEDAPAVDLEALAPLVAAKMPEPKGAPPVDLEALAAIVVARMPKPKDGEDGKSVEPEAIAVMVARAVQEVPRPKDGEDGLDAAQIDVHDGIDPLRRYQRGTFTTFRGGTVRARRQTDPLPEGGDLEKAGWQVIMNGLDSEHVEFGDDQRTITAIKRYTDGSEVRKEMTLPVSIHRGIWSPDGFEVAGVLKAFQRGDQVTRDGSQWTLMADFENGQPGSEGSGWKLSAKRGQDGARVERRPKNEPIRLSDS